MKLSLRSLLYEVVFEEKCPICGNKSQWKISPFCVTCWGKINPLENSRITAGQFHHDFWKYVDTLSCLSYYEGVLKEAIHVFKYLGVTRVGKELGKLLSNIEPPNIEVLIPVPLHLTKLKKREFNQSAIIAKELSKAWKIPIDLDSLVKIRNTSDQASLNEKERKVNIKDAFYLAKPLKFKMIGIVDDVVTTGATLSECGKILKRGGAEEVHAITLAKT